MSYQFTRQVMICFWKFFSSQRISQKNTTTIGESLKKETVELITLIYRANSKKDKFDVLQIAREHIEVIRLFIRLMKDLKQISLKKFVQVNKQEENVSKQLTGWQKKQAGLPRDLSRGQK